MSGLLPCPRAQRSFKETASPQKPPEGCHSEAALRSSTCRRHSNFFHCQWFGNRSTGIKCADSPTAQRQNKGTGRCYECQQLAYRRSSRGVAVFLLRPIGSPSARLFLSNPPPSLPRIALG